MAKKNKHKAPEQEHQIWESGDEESLTPLDSSMDKPKKAGSTQDSPTGFFMVDTQAGQGEPGPLDDEDLDNYISVGTNPEAVMDQIDNYTNDPDVLEDFADRQTYNQGSDELLQRLRQHNDENPGLSAGDLDAAWDDANQSGEETVGGLTPTPGQDRVEDIGEAVGVEYADNEKLDTFDKLDSRDRDRWELNPASAEAYDRDLEGDVDEEDLDDDLDIYDEDMDRDEDEIEDLAVLTGADTLPRLAVEEDEDEDDEEEYDDEDDDLDEDVEALDETFGLYDDGLDELDDEDLADLDDDDY